MSGLKVVRNVLKNAAAVGAGISAAALLTATGAPAIGGLIAICCGCLLGQSALQLASEQESERIEDWLKRLVRKFGDLTRAIDAIRDGKETYPGVAAENAAALSDILANTSDIESALNRHESLLLYGFEHLNNYLARQSKTIEQFTSSFAEFRSGIESKLVEIAATSSKGHTETHNKLDQIDKKIGEFIVLPTSPKPHEIFWPQHLIVPRSQISVQHFVGRRSELDQIQDATDHRYSVICVRGMAGQGKSSVLLKWYLDALSKLNTLGLFWCRPYDVGYTPTNFLAQLLVYLTYGEVDLREFRSSSERAAEVCRLLRQRPTVIVMDGIERWLARWSSDPDATGDDASVEDRLASEAALDLLLEDAATWTNGSMIIMSTRARPSVLDTRRHFLIGAGSTVGNRSLEGLDPEAAVELLRALGVDGSDEDLLDAADEYARHPLAVTVLGTLLSRLYGGDVNERPKVDPVRDDQSQRLARLLKRVDEHHKDSLGLLKLLSCCLVPAPIELLADLLNVEDKTLRERLAALTDWHIISFDGLTADAHALFRKYYRGLVSDGQANASALSIADWFLKRPTPDLPHKFEEISHLLIAFDHALAANNVDLADSILNTRPTENSHYSLSGWLRACGFLTEGIELFSRLIRLMRRLVDAEGRLELRDDLAGAYNNRGNALAGQGHLTEAVGDYDHAIESYRPLVEQENRLELRNDLASAYSNRGVALAGQGHLTRAVGDYERAIEIRKVLVEQENRPELRNDLAGTYNNRGLASAAQGHLTEAVGDYERAIEIRKVLVERENRLELRNDLASAYNNRGLALTAQGHLTKAVSDYNRAIEIRKELVETENRLELRNDLAGTYNNRGLALADQGHLTEAVGDYKRAIETYRVLVEQEGRDDLISRLESAFYNRAMASLRMEKTDDASQDFSQGGELLRSAINKGRRDLLPSFIQTVATCCRRIEALGEPAQVNLWLEDTARFLKGAKADEGFTPFERDAVTKLCATVEQHAAALHKQGVAKETTAHLLRFIEG